MRDRLLDCFPCRFGPARVVVPAVAAFLTLAVAAMVGGCDMFNMFNRPRVPAPVPPPEPVAASFDDTIGSYGDVPADRTVLVRGYGLVLLPKPTGSRECPPGIRKHIASQLNQRRVGESGTALEGLTIDQWIDSLTTAAVEVRGLMPVSGIKNQTFDLLVSALPGSQTTSLEGGVLLVTELSIWRRGITGGLITGKALAAASGPIFINPFVEPAKPDDVPIENPFAISSQPDESRDSAGRPVGTPVDFRRGWVLGGGLILKDQPLQLVLREPDYSHANIAMEQLNTRFPSPFLHGVAHARDPNVIELKVPPDFRSQVNYWLALVKQMYLRREPGFLPGRTVELVREMASADIPDSQRLRVAVTFAAIGKPCLPAVQPLYSNESPSVAFHSAYAGLRIGDNLALRVMLEIMRQKNHPYRLQAVRALGQPHPFVNIGPHLAPILDEDDAEIRAAAYDSMCRLGAPQIERYQVGLKQLGFRLDVVRCKGPYLVYVTRAEESRIALFGGDTMRLSPPAFLANDRTGTTISVSANDQHAQLMRVNPSDGRLMVVRIDEQTITDASGKPIVDPGTKQDMKRMVPITEMRSSLLLADVIRRLGSEPLRDHEKGELHGLGLNYSQVVHVLYQLSQTNALPSRIYLQQLRESNVELANEGPAFGGDETISSEPADQPDQNGQETKPPTTGEEPEMIIEQPAGRPKIGN